MLMNSTLDIKITQKYLDELIYKIVGAANEIHMNEIYNELQKK